MIKIQTFPFNPVQVNSYVLWDSETNACVLVDPGCWNKAEELVLVAFIDENALNVERIITTHAHFDHVAGNNFALDKWKTPLTGHKEADILMKRIPEMANWFNLQMLPAPPLTHHVKEGDTITFGTSTLEVIHVPGHSPGSIVLYSAAQEFMICGDVLFKGGIGHIDVPFGNLETLVGNIKKKLLTKPDTTIVYTGHGPFTTIGYERENNPFLS